MILLNRDPQDLDRIKLNRAIEHSTSLKGKKLVTSNVNKIKMLKFSKMRRDQMKMEISFGSIDAFREEPCQFPSLMRTIVKSYRKEIQEREEQREREYEGKREDLMKKRKSAVPGKVKSIGKVSHLLTQLKSHYNSERELDRTIQKINHSERESPLLNPNEAEVRYRRNSFFKSHKSHVYLRNKSKGVSESNLTTSRSHVSRTKKTQTLEPVNPELLKVTFGMKSAL